MLFKDKKQKQQCFWCGFKFSDLLVVDGKLTCYICLRTLEKKK